MVANPKSGENKGSESGGLMKKVIRTIFLIPAMLVIMPIMGVVKVSERLRKA